MARSALRWKGRVMGSETRIEPDIIAFAKALARAQVARDIAAIRAAQMSGQQGDDRADGNLRTLQQR